MALYDFNNHSSKRNLEEFARVMHLEKTRSEPNSKIWYGNPLSEFPSHKVDIEYRLSHDYPVALLTNWGNDEAPKK